MLSDRSFVKQGNSFQDNSFSSKFRVNRLVFRRAFIEDKVTGGPGISHRSATLAGRTLVELDYNDLANGKDLSAQIEEALGPDGLGALLVANVPGYPERRRRLLPQANSFASLPDEVKAKYEDPESHFSVGWSHGKEFLSDGQPDIHKGSFYANPLSDDQLRPSPSDSQQPWLHQALRGASASTAAAGKDAGAVPRNACGASADAGATSRAAGLEPAEVERLRRLNPGYFRPNVWPREDLPELEPALKDLGRLICAVGCLLAEHCDSYVSSRLSTPRGQLSGVLRRSLNPKARLLHYFPSPVERAAAASGSEHEQPWCGWHTDHGSLTGLTSAMYMDEAGREVPCPDPKAGLYIRDRRGAVVRASIPADCVAFQVGEALQVHSGGLLLATPHYVRAARGAAAVGISRNTFAVFMQPNVDEPMDCLPGVDPQQVAVGQWRPGQNFGQFAEATFQKYYGASS